MNVIRGAETVKQRLRIGRNGEHGVMLRREKLLVAHVGKKLKQEVIVPTGIEQPDRFEVQAKLKPREYLDDLFQCADAARKSDKRVGELRHAVFALVHCLDRYQFGKPLVCALLGNHGPRNDADDLASGCQRGIRQRAHQADAAAAIDDGETATSARGAES